MWYIPLYLCTLVEIQDAMYEFCTERDYIYITHSTLQSTSCALYIDDKHINEKGGTAVFVSDILNGTGYRKQRRSNADYRGASKGKNEQVFVNKQHGLPGLPHSGNNLNAENNPQLMKMMLTYCLQTMLK